MFMANPDQNTTPHEKEIDAISIQLRSQRLGDIWQGLEQVNQWLQENPDNREVYIMLLDAVQDNPTLREKVRNLLLDMSKKGSKFAESALHDLPSSVQDLLADADDVYYAGQYDEAIKLYLQVLKLNPQNERAKDHINKAEIKRLAGELDTDLPRAAVQYYRRARSFIAARDVSTAMNLLSAAIEAAQAKGMKYPDAEQALNSIQDLLIADESRQSAKIALENKQWQEALELMIRLLN
jgi:tetratricopeptide (TPR) repeat protein